MFPTSFSIPDRLGRFRLVVKSSCSMRFCYFMVTLDPSWLTLLPGECTLRARSGVDVHSWLSIVNVTFWESVFSGSDVVDVHSWLSIVAVTLWESVFSLLLRRIKRCKVILGLMVIVGRQSMVSTFRRGIIIIRRWSGRGNHLDR